MIDLEFEKVDGYGYVAKATINSNAQLHVERFKDKPFTIMRSSMSMAFDLDQYCAVEGTETKRWGKTVDVELTANVFPVYLAFVSQSEVDIAFIREANE